MSNQANLDTVKRLYAAFGAGDLQSLFNVLDTAIEWTVPGAAPWSGDGRGHEHVKKFFEAFGTAASLTTFEPRRFLTDGEQVVVLGYEEGTASSTGRGWKAHFTHVFTLADGKITSHREYVDTQAIADAFRS